MQKNKIRSQIILKRQKRQRKLKKVKKIRTNVGTHHKTAKVIGKENAQNLIN